jgi:hypothetical protein
MARAIQTLAARPPLQPDFASSAEILDCGRVFSKEEGYQMVLQRGGDDALSMGETEILGLLGTGDGDGVETGATFMRILWTESESFHLVR